MPSYIQKRYRRWYAIMEIPASLRPHFGKPRFIKSLETESLTIAERRVLSMVAGWKQEIATARNEPEDDVVARQPSIRVGRRLPLRSVPQPPVSARRMRQALRNAKTEEQRQAILEEIEEVAHWLEAVNVENIGDVKVEKIGDVNVEKISSETRQWLAIATGAQVPFTEHLDEWLATSRATDKTQDMQRSDVKRFAVKFAMVQDVARPEVKRWITKLMNDDELAPKTVQRILSALRSYWRYLQSIEVAGENDEPFSRLDVARQNKRTAPRSVRRPFEPADVLKLLDAAMARGDDHLADLITLGMWTGCRIEELCALKVAQVKDDHLSIDDAKTAAGWRDVPIHRELAQTMTRLIKGSNDGYVISGLTLNKYGDRSNAVGKRFGRLKKGLGFGPQYVFHSIRKTFVTILYNSGAAEHVVADIVGHEKPTMTFWALRGRGIARGETRGAGQACLPQPPVKLP